MSSKKLFFTFYDLNTRVYTSLLFSNMLNIFYNKYRELLIYKYYFLGSHCMTIYNLNYTFHVTNDLIF